MPLTSHQRSDLLAEFAREYVAASKKDKSRILDQVTNLLGYNRSYARRALQGIRSQNRTRSPRRGDSHRGRPKLYGHEILAPLRMIWSLLDYPCGKRLAPFLGEMVSCLERSGELHLTDNDRTRLLSISSATIDRLLAADRRRLGVHGRSGTKPGSLLKDQIPVKTFADWDDSKPGFLEIDLVGHEGGYARGDYAHTLDVVDVSTGWCEFRAVKNKAQKWVFEALMIILDRLPFGVLGIDCDNGSEFINDQLHRFCLGRQITFTRARPGKKNDNCYIEQKNWSVVRKAVGYMRYDTDEAVAKLNELYEVLRLFINFFQPSMKLQDKHRSGAKVTKTYDQARTPYQRVIESPYVADTTKEQLTAAYLALNPVQLRRTIQQLQDDVVSLHTRLPDKR